MCFSYFFAVANHLSCFSHCYCCCFYAISAFICTFIGAFPLVFKTNRRKRPTCCLSYRYLAPTLSACSSQKFTHTSPSNINNTNTISQPASQPASKCHLSLMFIGFLLFFVVFLLLFFFLSFHFLLLPSLLPHKIKIHWHVSVLISSLRIVV